MTSSALSLRGGRGFRVMNAEPVFASPHRRPPPMKETTLAMAGSSPRIWFTCDLPVTHRGVAHVLRCLAEPDEQAVVLLREEGLGD